MEQYPPLEKAVEYIEAHMNENIGLADVSRETGYSYYHMTRLFSSVLGESAGRYINRRRLYKASEQLIYSEQKVIDIANNISRSPKIVLLEETKIAGLRGTTSLSDNRIPELWKQFHSLRKEVFAAPVGYSICETKQTAYTKDGNVLFSVMVGGPMRDFDHLPQELSRKTLSAGRYAVFTHRGTLANLYKTYRYIFGTWLPSTKEDLDDREDFEIYEHEIHSFDDPDNKVKIFIPVKN